jgi:Synaptobrevin
VALSKLEDVTANIIENLGTPRFPRILLKNKFWPNLETLLERDEKVDLLHRKSSQLSVHSTSMRETATRVKNKTWWDLWKMRILIFGAIAIVNFQEMESFIIWRHVLGEQVAFLIIFFIICEVGSKCF